MEDRDKHLEDGWEHGDCDEKGGAEWQGDNSGMSGLRGIRSKSSIPTKMTMVLSSHGDIRRFMSHNSIGSGSGRSGE